MYAHTRMHAHTRMLTPPPHSHAGDTPALTPQTPKHTFAPSPQTQAHFKSSFYFLFLEAIQAELPVRLKSLTALFMCPFPASCLGKKPFKSKKQSSATSSKTTPLAPRGACAAFIPGRGQRALLGLSQTEGNEKWLREGVSLLPFLVPLAKETLNLPLPKERRPCRPTIHFKCRTIWPSMKQTMRLSYRGLTIALN